MRKIINFFSTLRKFKRDLEGRRFLYTQAILAWIPSFIGYTIRGRFYRKWIKSVGPNTLFLERLYIRNPQLMTIGSNCSMGIDCAIQAAGGLTIGNYVILGPGVKIWTSNHIYADPNVPIYNQGSEFKPVVIEDDTWIGANAFIMPGTHLGKGCVVAAGAIVSGRRYKDFSILAGNPARVIGFRGQQNKPETSAPEKES
ncbi:MAG: acyltransferase [bacterium]|jgi:acetyltransferase-like isoleucine patch superfamily enzyme